MTRPCRALESLELSPDLLPREWSRRGRREVSPGGSQCAQSALPCFSPFQTRDATTVERTVEQVTASPQQPGAQALVHTRYEAIAPWVAYDANSHPSLG